MFVMKPLGEKPKSLRSGLNRYWAWQNRCDGRDPLTWQDTDAKEEERDYRHWCLVNCLYLNPLNDLGPYTVSATDSMGLATHVVPVDAPHLFASFFGQMKQEYVSARWLLYEGLTAKMPHFSDRNVLLEATEPRPSLSLAIEKVKAAYRISYSLFDKVSFDFDNPVWPTLIFSFGPPPGLVGLVVPFR